MIDEPVCLCVKFSLPNPVEGVLTVWLPKPFFLICATLPTLGFICGSPNGLAFLSTLNLLVGSGEPIWAGALGTSSDLVFHIVSNKI